MIAPPEITRIEEAIGFQRKLWRAERLGWLGMLAVVLAALLGLLGGGGPLAEGSARDGALEIQGPRIARLGSAAPLRVTLPPGQGEAELRLPADFPVRWRVRDMAPAAVTSAGGAGAFVLHLPRAADGTVAATLHIEPTGAPGLRSLRIESAGRAVDLAVLVWP